MGSRSVLVLLCTVFVYTAQTRNCCMPPQWEAMQVETGGAVVNQTGVMIRDFFAISYDGTNKRQSVIANDTVGAIQTATWTIKNFGEGLMYTINLKAQTCEKTKINFPMESTCVPENATRGVDVVYGGGSKTLQCQTYSWRQSTANTLVDLFLVVAVDGDVCYPVAEEAVGSENDIPLVETYVFVDITKGIKNPSIFTPPSYCNQVPLSSRVAKRGHTFLGLYL